MPDRSRNRPRIAGQRRTPSGPVTTAFMGSEYFVPK